MMARFALPTRRPVSDELFHQAHHFHPQSSSWATALARKTRACVSKDGNLRVSLVAMLRDASHVRLITVWSLRCRRLFAQSRGRPGHFWCRGAFGSIVWLASDSLPVR